MLLREKREGVRDTGAEAPHTRDSFQAQERSIIDARAVFIGSLLPWYQQLVYLSINNTGRENNLL
jgi:hypothetical protein